MSLAIIVPYRNREYYLNLLLTYLPKYLNDNGISNYYIVVSEQYDNNIFNRSLSLNVGIKYAIENLSIDYLVIQDVDIIPVSEVDYNYPGFFMVWFACAGGVISSVSDILKINGYSNDYVGWGEEDVDFIKKANFYSLDVKEWKNILYDKRPVMVNMEYQEFWDTRDLSLSYWEKEWPRYIKASEYGIDHYSANKEDNWYNQEYITNNWNRSARIDSMEISMRNIYYQNSGLNQINLKNLSRIEINNIYHKILYNTESIKYT